MRHYTHEGYKRQKELWYFQTIRIEHDQAEGLKKRAHMERTSVPEVIRKYVTWGLEADGEE